jgi:hypothetical protein
VSPTQEINRKWHHFRYLPQEKMGSWCNINLG